MNKQPLHSKSFNEAVLQELSIDRDGKDTKEISVYLPKWIRTPIDILHIESEISAAKIYTGIVNHGTAILQHNFNDEINAFQSVRRNILRSDNEFNKDFIQYFKPVGDTTFIKPYRRTITIPEWCIGYIGNINNSFPIEYSASVRMVMYYSLEKWDNIPTMYKTNCRKEIDAFENGIDDYIKLCNGIADESIARSVD